MTANDVLEALYVAGVAVWLENGKLGIYPTQRLTPQLKEALCEHRHGIARIIQEQHSCWRCGSHRVRYDVPLRRYVCDDCRWALQDPFDPFPPIHELVLLAGAFYGYPKIQLTPFATLESGREAWLRFCTAPIIGNHLHLLVTAYRKLANPAEAVDIDEPETTTPNTKEENDMKIVWTSTEPIPTGEYRVRVESITEQKSKFDDTVQLVWKLRVLNSEFEGRELTAWTNATTSTKSKLAKWARACGYDIVAGDEFDTDDLVGCKVIAVVTVKRTDAGELFNRVEDLLPLHARETVTVGATRDSEDEDDGYDPFVQDE
jgi:hypothetical protein